MITLSILLPIYNAERYIQQAIDSILTQRYRDFELLLLNDGSTDGSISIINSYSDARIRVIHNETNKGLIYTLNNGIRQAKGKYIGRMDADDIATSERFERQIALLEQNPSIGFCGTWAQQIDQYGAKGAKMRKPSRGELTQALLLFTCIYIHPTMVFRRSILPEDPYLERWKHTEDYALWIYLSEKSKGVNMPFYGLYYRWHDQNISQTAHALQSELNKELVVSQLQQLGITPNEAEYQLHIATFQLYSLSKQQRKNAIDLLSLSIWFERLMDANNIALRYDPSALRAILLNRWIITCIATRQYSFLLYPPLVPSLKECWWTLALFKEKS